MYQLTPWEWPGGWPARDAPRAGTARSFADRCHAALVAAAFDAGRAATSAPPAPRARSH